MKITGILAIIGIALCVTPAQAFFPLLGLMNPFLLGPWGMGMFGPWGMGFGLGFRRFGLGFRGRFIGKREVDGMEDIEEDNADLTLCSYTSKNNMISCHGIEHNFQCRVAPRFDELKSGSYRIQNLTVVPETITVGKTEHEIYNLFSVQPRVGELNDFTLIEKPDRHVTFSLWRGRGIERTGLRFVEDKCWKSFESLMAIPERVRFALFISREPIVKA